MPSNSYKTFNKEYKKDIEKILSNYEELKGTHKGKRSLDHVFRSGVLLLAAAWEVYIEDVLVESCYLIANKIELDNLPIPVKKNICSNAKKEKDELALLNILGAENWRGFFLEIVETDIKNLNTPKSAQIDSLFNKHLGIDTVSSNFTRTGLDDFITTRGEIAHRMKGEEYLKKEVFIDYVSLIDCLVIDIDIFLYAYLKGVLGKTPWNDTYPRRYVTSPALNV